MSLFRSDPMGYFRLVASREDAWDILNELGALGVLQFVDLNLQDNNFKRPYSNFVKRCEDLENKLTQIENYMNKFELPIEPCDDPKEFLRQLNFTVRARNKVEKTYLNDVEAEIQEKMGLLAEQIRSYETLIENYNHLVEYREVLIKTQPFVQNDSLGNMQAQGNNDPFAVRGDIRFAYLTGVINKEDSLRFRKILFRITRGMTYTALIDIDRPADEFDKNHPSYFLDSAKNTPKEKTVFLVVYQGGEHGMLKSKLDKVCDAFGASKYGLPSDPSAFYSKIQDVERQIFDSQGVVFKTKGLIGSILQYFSDPTNRNTPYSHIEGLKMFVKKEKALYHNLNLLKPQNVLNIGNCWCPLDKLPEVRTALQELKRKKDDIGTFEFREIPAPSGKNPPTHFKTNIVTGVFQDIVNTYGVPRYREINPALFTIATFPFLFGVMFGDILHGGLLFAFGIYLLFWKDSIEKNKGNLLNAVLPVRYLMILQGMFAFYCGLIYNDFTSFPLHIGTCYGHPDKDGVMKKDPDCSYPFGVDPSWYGTSNELTFLNSFKMKLSIVLGVSHMLFGIILRGLNSIYAKKALDFIFEFVPMIIFMSVTFGYMAFLIILKWSIPWSNEKDAAYPIEKSPSIITIFIKMALTPGEWDPSVIPLYGERDGSTQASVQLVFLITAMICANLILFPKPIILNSQQKSHKKANPQDSHLKDSLANYNASEVLLERPYDDNQLFLEDFNQNQNAEIERAEEAHGHEEHHSFGDLFVHQVIETIEFVLGSISNTASYLRLWALSLAHSQLANVFFANTMGMSITKGIWLGPFLTWWFFANVTFGILLLMDQLECFLHALRLHWVEFQNKFYKADGYAFAPFSYEQSLKNAQE